MGQSLSSRMVLRTFHAVNYNQSHCYVDQKSGGNNKSSYQASYSVTNKVINRIKKVRFNHYSVKNKFDDRNKRVRFNKVYNAEGIWFNNNRIGNVNRERSYPPHTEDTVDICKLIDDRNKAHNRVFHERKSAFMHIANQYDQGDIFAVGSNKESRV